MAWVSSIISSRVPTDIGVPRRSSTLDLKYETTNLSIKPKRITIKVEPLPLFLIPFLLWFKPLLIANKLLFHQQVILYSLHFQQLQTASRVRSDLRELCGRFRTLDLLPFLTNTSWDWRLIFFLPVFVFFLVTSCSSTSSTRLVLTLRIQMMIWVRINSFNVSFQ